MKVMRSPLSRKIISRIVLISFLIILCNAFLQIVLTYRSGLRSIENTLVLIEESHLESIATSVYRVEDEILKMQLEGLTVHEGIVFARVRELRGNDVIFSSAGDSTIRWDRLKEFPLVHIFPDGSRRGFGTLLLAVNLDGLYQSLCRKALIILLENIIIIFLLSLLIFIITELTVTRHLIRMADFANGVGLDRLDRDLKLDRRKKQRAPRDELDILVESIGRLAGGVAHDLNNLLTPILLCGDILSNRSGEGDPNAEIIDSLIEAGSKAKELVEQLLTFSRKTPLIKEKLRLNSLVGSYRNLLGRTMGDDIRLEFSLSEEDPLIYGNKVQIEQVLMNLSINGRDAMEKTGVLNFTTGIRTLKAGGVPDCPGIEEGEYAYLSVGDTGCGMTEEEKTKIFEPFFSTKGDRGTGLGLATVYGIVTDHKGYIHVESKVGEGTLFEILLPCVRETIRRN